MAGKRDLLLVIGFLRGGTMYPFASSLRELSPDRSLKLVQESMAEQEVSLFGAAPHQVDADDMKRRSAMMTWCGDLLPVSARVGEAPDPGVLLCLLYDGPAADAVLPAEVFAQTLRRYALRDPLIRARFDEHVDRAGTYIPSWHSPEARKQRSQAQFDAAMKVAREQGFSHAAPLFEGVRGDCFAQAQVAIAVYEKRELGDRNAAIGRLDEVVRVAPRHVAARMQRAALLVEKTGREIDAATDYVLALRELCRDGTGQTSEVAKAALEAVWKLNAEFADAKALGHALSVLRTDEGQGIDLLSRYIQTHPCSWDAQVRLAPHALRRQQFDLVIKTLAQARWLYADDPNPHFVYGQAMASLGKNGAAMSALEYARSIAPNDPEIAEWLGFVKHRVELEQAHTAEGMSAVVAAHVARSLLVALAVVRGGSTFPSATHLTKLPGDVALSFVMQNIARRTSRQWPIENTGTADKSDGDLSGMEKRTELYDYQGGRLSTEQTVGDVSDPGIVIALYYDDALPNGEGPHDEGRREPPSESVRKDLMNALKSDSLLHAKLERHMQSPDATVKYRLGV